MSEDRITKSPILSEGPESPPVDLSSSSSSSSSSSHKLTRDISRFVGRKPLPCLLGGLFLCCILTITAVTAGNFEVVYENDGWKSRGTAISKREIQSHIILDHREDLVSDKFISLPPEAQDSYSSPWDYMQQNVIPGGTQYGSYGRRRLAKGTKQKSRRVDEEPLTCHTIWFDQPNLTETFPERNHLVAIWKINSSKDDPTSILNAKALVEICNAEYTTKHIIGANNFCDTCDDENCPPPFSLVTLLSTLLESTLGIKLASCEELGTAYTPIIQETVTELLLECSNSFRENFSSEGNVTCSIPGFSPHLVDSAFGVGDNKLLRYTSSIFYSSEPVGDDEAVSMYAIHKSFGKGNKLVTGTYDTTHEDLSDMFIENSLIKDTVRISSQTFSCIFFPYELIISSMF